MEVSVKGSMGYNHNWECGSNDTTINRSSRGEGISVHTRKETGSIDIRGKYRERRESTLLPYKGKWQT